MGFLSSYLFLTPGSKIVPNFPRRHDPPFSEVYPLHPIGHSPPPPSRLCRSGRSLWATLRRLKVNSISALKGPFRVPPCPSVFLPFAFLFPRLLKSLPRRLSFHKVPCASRLILNTPSFAVHPIFLPSDRSGSFFLRPKHDPKQTNIRRLLALPPQNVVILLNSDFMPRVFSASWQTQE